MGFRPTDPELKHAQLRRIPSFQTGDCLRVHFVEGADQRVFEGVVTEREGHGVRETFTVRKQSFGVDVERTFPVHSPKIERIAVVDPTDERRASVYYLRDRFAALEAGDSARLAERNSALGPLWSVDEAARRLLLTSEQLEALAADAAVIALPTGEGPLLPAWQFEIAERRHRLAELHGQLVADFDVSPWAAASWFVAEHPRLDGLSPIEWLDNDGSLGAVSAVLAEYGEAAQTALGLPEPGGESVTSSEAPSAHGSNADSRVPHVDPRLFRLRLFEEDWLHIIRELTGRLAELLDIEARAWQRLGETLGYFPESAQDGSPEELPDGAAAVLPEFWSGVELRTFDRALYESRAELTPDRLEYLFLVLDADDDTWDVAVRQAEHCMGSDGDLLAAFDTAAWCLYGDELPAERLVGTPADWRGSSLLIPSDESVSSRVSVAAALREELVGRFQDQLQVNAVFPGL